jgi:hypothetical protein
MDSVMQTTYIFTLNFEKSLKSGLERIFKENSNDTGALRVEARLRFIGRVMDAVSAALSKHDQVFLPASTRLGRVRGAIPTCMACDRPLSTKGARPAKMEPDCQKSKKMNNICTKRHFGMSYCPVSTFDRHSSQSIQY